MIQRVRRARETKTTEIQADEGLMIDSRKITATTGVEKIVNGTMETTTMEVVMTTTQDTARTITKETSKTRVASPERITQMGEGVEMTQTHRRTTTQIRETGIQRGTKGGPKTQKETSRGR
jgi:pentose-5-phosphate-3-epimerase